MNVRRWLITIVSCVLLFAILASYKTLQIKEAIEVGKSFPEPSETVEATNVLMVSVQPSVTTIGEVVAPQTLELRNELEGQITVVNFMSGGRVKKGDLLIKLDIREEQARLRAAEARAELSKLDLARVQKLLNNKTVSEERMDQARAEYEVAKAEIQELEATISKKHIRAPFDAHAGIHQFEPGEFLQSNTLITTLVGINDYKWVDFNLPLKQSDIAIGSAISVRLANRPDKTLVGKVIARDAAMSSNSRNLRFRARIESPENVPPNAIVNLSVDSGTKVKMPQIPTAAYRIDQLGEFAFVLEPAEDPGAYRAKRRTITTYDRDHNFVTISSGLQAGELIATQGAFKLRNNLLVYIKQNSPASGDVSANEH